MARTISRMLPLGTGLPKFELAAVQVPGVTRSQDEELCDKGIISSSRLPVKPLLIMVICAHCPFVKHIEQALTDLERDYGKSVQMIAISSNSLVTHPQDGPQNLALQLKQNGWNFPYLLDKDQSLAKALQAACTPDFYLFSPNADGIQSLRYRGQLDNSRPGNDIPVSGNDLRAAIDSVLSGNNVSDDQKPSIGCNIKWDPGNEPDWFS